MMEMQKISTTYQPATPSKYDITKIINEIFTGIFRDVDWRTKLQSASGTKFFHTFNIELPAKNTLPQFGNEIYLNCSITTIDILGITIKWDFIRDKVNIELDKIKFSILGEVKEKPSLNTTISSFLVLSLTFKNFSISSEKNPINQPGDEKIQTDVSYDGVTTEKGIKASIHQSKLSYEEQLELIHAISLPLESVIRDGVINRTKFSDLLNTMFSLNPQKRITSVDPDFPLNTHQYYYLIPEIPIIHASLRNIKIFGLWNFEPYFYNKKITNSQSFKLIIKNIHGKMILDSGFRQWPQFSINFSIHELSISAEVKLRGVRVKVQNCSISEEVLEPDASIISSWLTKFSTFIIELLESAVEISIITWMNKDDFRSSFSSSSIREAENSLIEILKKSTAN
ncbi:uncharacterized protein LOC135848829 isoform X2 [Planococcus citri]|uniref:uncharacterized protein LOC135848829 isoform X2 n=1 Tax=Planococcus citri TaxID=170843 RepID=UPI0031F77F17